MSKELTFIVSDESRNTYGLKLKSDGGDFTQFLKNPVMLHDHKDWEMPFGTWKELKLHDNKDITAVPVFDTDDAQALRLKNKVDKGIIKMASVGVIPIEFDEKTNTVTKWELREISITTFGANKNAFAFYDTKGIELKSRDEVLKLSATTNSFNKDNNKTDSEMSKENDYLGMTLRAGLNLSENTSDGELIRKVLELSSKNTVLEQQLADQKKEKENAEAAIQLKEKNDYLTQAVTDKKITLSQKEVYAKMELSDIKAVLDNAPATVDLSQVPGGGTPGLSPWEQRMAEINKQ